ELSLVIESLGPGRPVSQLHFGGGSPTFLSDAELTRLMTTQTGSFVPKADINEGQLCSKPVKQRSAA
ncbi:MAG: hypothetical protein H7346_23415, partial [Burkholderiaceae bacterium]|nr:hypothetical protein [Burkholderiaceae bacterium]